MDCSSQTADLETRSHRPMGDALHFRFHGRARASFQKSGEGNVMNVILSLTLILPLASLCINTNEILDQLFDL